jgi:predicted GNAT family acetyltransferase
MVASIVPSAVQRWYAPTVSSRTIANVDATITDADAAQRYEARLDGDRAGFLDYVVKHDRIALIHTEVLPAYQGRGIGESLARFALDDARRRGLRVIVTCPYVRAYVERHPETHDIVVGMTPA